jgi:tRNA-2-methylthio-N6-dimethylallyladenosine synthase
MNTDPSKKLKVAIRTFGCQMNMYDTEVAEGLLQQGGFEIMPLDLLNSEESTDGRRLPPEFSADVVLMNTCSVREHAEDRVFGRLGMLGKEKRRNPNLIVGLMGCMVEEHREKLFRRFPQLDLMVGTRNINELPSLIEDVIKNRAQVSRIKQDGISIEYTDLIQRKGKYHAWLPIMTGCNKVCTFCIVPITRGSEVSMQAREVYREATRLVEDGVKWITLLGQNVNSYDGAEVASSTTPPRNDGEPLLNLRFPQLLEMLCGIPGLEKISFTTSHPQDATRELFEVIARNAKISRRFHLPLQSGSDRVLKRMKRLHTYASYKEKIDLLRSLVPDIAISTDIIVGFSGETDEDHEMTKQALQEIRYDGAYIYKYSVRPSTPAAKLPDDVPQTVKEARNAELMKIQAEISKENNLRWIGKTVLSFAEEENPRIAGQLMARNDHEKKVVFVGEPDLIGTFQPIHLTELHGETFIGKLNPSLSS